MNEDDDPYDEGGGFRGFPPPKNLIQKIQSSYESTEDDLETNKTKDGKKPDTKRKDKRKREKNADTENKKINNNKSPEVRLDPPHLEPRPQTYNTQMEIDNIPNPTTQNIQEVRQFSQLSSTHLLPNKNNNTQQQTNTYKSTKNYSAKMNEIRGMEYNCLFYIMVENNLNTDRLGMVEIWNSKFPNSEDVILKTKIGFIVKSNNDKDILITALDQLKSEKKIISYKETKNLKYSRENHSSPATFSVVIANVESKIDENEISQFLTTNHLNHRYCKRIISKISQSPSNFIRIITGEINTFETLLNQGLFFKNRHYLVYPSHPPKPIPIPCNKCHLFTHTTENCNNEIKCPKCQGSHKMSQCKTQLPPKCTACNREDHQAWSTKCP